MGMQFKILSAELRLMTHITLIKESMRDGAFMPKFTILLASDKWLILCHLKCVLADGWLNLQERKHRCWHISYRLRTDLWLSL